MGTREWVSKINALNKNTDVLFQLNSLSKPNKSLYRVHGQVYVTKQLPAIRRKTKTSTAHFKDAILF